MTTDELSQIIEQCSQEWLLEGKREEKLRFLLRKLHETYVVFQQQFQGTGDDEISLNDEILRQERGSHEIVTLLQALPRHSPRALLGQPA